MDLTLSRLIGTLKSTFKIGKATLDASGVATARSITVPDKAGTLALTSDITGTNSNTNTGDNAVNTSYQALTRSEFFKADPATVVFTKTAAGTVSLKAGTIVATPNATLTFATATAVTMCSLSAGTDYAIYACDDGFLHADASFSYPTGYTAANSRKIGGFHYAPGGNAVAIAKTAVTTGTAIGAQTVSIDKWALYRLSIVANGTITITPAAANAAGYTDEAAAIAAIPATAASSCDIGYITVKTKTGTTFVAGTDSLAGGSGGNVASTTNYYPSTGCIGCVLSRGSTNQNIASTAFTYWLGGDVTAAINVYSLWDIKFRPIAPDPRGKALVSNGFWADIYLTGVDAITNGSSKYGVAYADGASPPKIPASFGGNGSTAYATFNWWEANEMASSFGMRLPSQQEFMALAYGVTEASSEGTERHNTGLYAAYTSRWGIMQATGCLWVWGAMRAGPYASAAWNPATGTTASRGSEYNAPNAVLFGGTWYNATNSGSRCSNWNNTAAASIGSIGSRLVCDHLQLD